MDKKQFIVRKRYFNENGLKPITDIGRILQNKQNWLCEYRIVYIKYLVMVLSKS